MRFRRHALEATVDPEQAAGAGKPGRERDGLGVGQAADEVDDAASAAHPGELGVRHLCAQPVGWVLAIRW